MTWNTDISAAPRGRFVERIIMTTTRGEQKSMDFVPDHVWLAMKGGQVLRSFWVPPTAKETTGRWHGCSAKETPIAWQPFVKPEFPSELEEKNV